MKARDFTLNLQYKNGAGHMLTFILIMAIALGLTYGANVAVFKTKPCRSGMAIAVTAGISILSTVLGLVAVGILVNLSGYKIKGLEKAVGPSITIAILVTWATLKKRKMGDPPSRMDEAPRNRPTLENPLVDEAPTESTTAPASLNSQDPKASIPQWSRRLKIVIGFACGLALLACLFPPFRMRVTPYPTNPLMRETLAAVGVSDTPYQTIERAFFLDPPEPTARVMGYETEIAWDHLTLELTIVAALSALLFALMKEGRWPLRLPERTQSD